MWLAALCATALAGEVVVRQDTPLLTPWVVEAEARTTGTVLGVDAIVLPALPGATNDLWVLGSGLSSLTDVHARYTVRGAWVADWLGTGGYATLTDTLPQQAVLWDGGEVVDRFFIEPLWTAPVGTSALPTEVVTCAPACSANAFCLAQGSAAPTCECKAGFELSGPDCVDVDECPDACGDNSVCTNTTGGFTCDCEPGYDWVGAVCTNLDECDLGTDDCDPLATCADTDGDFTCTCPDGYAGDGTSCADVDECALGLDDCDLAAACTNADGGFTCECPDGWSGDGTECTPPPDPCDPDPCDAGEVCTDDGGVASCDCLPGWAPQTVGCAPVCGDGMVALGAEECDDDNLDPGDGCASDCTVEDGWVCDDRGCLPDRDGDGIADVDDDCPDDWDPEQLDTDDDGVGDACQGDTGDTGDGPDGGCGCNGTGGLPVGLLVVLPLLVTRRQPAGDPRGVGT